MYAIIYTEREIQKYLKRKKENKDMKKFTLTVLNERNEIIEKHNTNDFKKCMKRIKMHDDSGALFERYFHCNIIVINNTTGRVLSDEEVWF